MSKLFFKGRIETRQNHVLSGYNVDRDVKPGTEEAPINIDENQEENTIELDTLLNKAKPTVFEKKPNRNDPCSCGSGKKYKKCCA
ncbi:PBPRA1643 family SWIM/SEC-C metal-binding motif protein [Vibrio parahaemolyticus]|uniref:PBPRA1643 family SWIM/SEC-C metal-binding motif protein n=1 Tax=Vibrio parahaemolyticus TaxID=670 RepID=UPI0011230850|nr:PBPRA1643 family SWIM/SEC-C metal-binding motif protein [Vibrio parahaemolyticus]TOG44905.1 zinc chelation protein SecC [Vibrio parahaemolyticus]